MGNNILGLAMNNILLKESKLIINPLLRNVVKWSDTHQKILQQMLQDFESVSDYFTTLRSKGLVNQMRVDIIFEPIIASHLSNSKSTLVYNDL